MTLDDFDSKDPAMQKCLDLARLAARTAASKRDHPRLARERQVVAKRSSPNYSRSRALHDRNFRSEGGAQAEDVDRCRPPQGPGAAEGRGEGHDAGRTHTSVQSGIVGEIHAGGGRTMTSKKGSKSKKTRSTKDLSPKAADSIKGGSGIIVQKRPT
jgi:hypothetical protein